MKKSLFILWVAIIAMCMPQRVLSQPQSPNSDYVLLPDSSNFVTVSLMVVSPGKDIYSLLGHCALHLECPIHKLDYCFSFGTNGDNMDVLKFFAGNLSAGFLAVPTQDFIDVYRREGREVKQVELNLALHEQQRLWQLLDQDMIEGDYRKFNYLQNNCASMSMCPLEWSLIDEQLTVNKWPEPMELVNGDGVRYLSRNTPWLSFLNMTLLGAESDTYWPNENRISPELIMDVLSNSTITPNDGSPARPVLKAAPETLLPLEYTPSPTLVTPVVAFSALLVIVLLVTILQLLGKCDVVGRVIDIILFAGQTIAGVLLVYMSTVTCLFGLHWNWYLIVFNPLPLLLWAVARKKQWYSKVYLVYTIVLLVFLCLWPVSVQFDLDHQLLTITLAVRTAYNYKRQSISA